MPTGGFVKNIACMMGVLEHASTYCGYHFKWVLSLYFNPLYNTEPPCLFYQFFCENLTSIAYAVKGVATPRLEPMDGLE